MISLISCHRLLLPSGSQFCSGVADCPLRVLLPKGVLFCRGVMLDAKGVLFCGGVMLDAKGVLFCKGIILLAKGVFWRVLLNGVVFCRVLL